MSGPSGLGGLGGLLGSIGLGQAIGPADYGAALQQLQAQAISYPTFGATYTTNAANTIQLNIAPGQLPASGPFVPDEVAWLKQRVREIEWRP